MAEINLRRFVDINIVYHSISLVNSIRDIVALLSTEGTTGPHGPYSSYEDFEEDFPEPSGTDPDTYPLLRAYVKMFFANHGNKVIIYGGLTDSDEAITAAIAALPNEYVVVAYAATEGLTASRMYNVASIRAADVSIYGINQKILLGRTTSSTFNQSTENFAVKYSNYVGAEMTIAAYLSNIDFSGIDTVLDYMYTKEVITAEANDDTVLGAVLDNNMNVDMKLAQAVTNLGGNLKDGLSLTNQFALIVLHQILTDRLVELLMTKIKGPAGISAIQSVVSNEMRRWLINGYLATDKVWMDETKKVSHNGQTYTIISKNEPLPLGYKFVVLPFESLTLEERAQRKAPPMYMIVSDIYGIRSIAINGEVI